MLHIKCELIPSSSSNNKWYARLAVVEKYWFEQTNAFVGVFAEYTKKLTKIVYMFLMRAKPMRVQIRNQILSKNATFKLAEVINLFFTRLFPVITGKHQLQKSWTKKKN